MKKHKILRLVIPLAVFLLAAALIILPHSLSREQSSDAEGQTQLTEQTPESENFQAAETDLAPETEESQAVEIAEPTETDVTVSLAGDCSLGKLSIHGYDGSFYQYYDDYGPSYFFQNVSDYFTTDSMTLVNFEGVLTDCNDTVEKEFNIKGRPEFIDILPTAGIEAVSFGNNHRIDYGEQGYTDTIALFEENDISWAYDDNLAVYTTPEGITIGYVSVNVVYDGSAVETYLENGINELKDQGVDLIYCCCHWGTETHHYIDDYQQELGHKCIDWGADLVIGCHPHVLQGFENYKGKYIIYSLGNFCFGGNMNPKVKDSMIVQASYHFTDGVLNGEPVLTVIPVTISSVSSYNDFCPTPANEEKSAEIIADLNEYSADFNVTIDDSGVLSYTSEE